jgi:hypothetical protein
MDFVCDHLGAEWTIAHQGRFDALASKPGKKDVVIRVVCRFPSPRMQAVELTAKGSTLKLRIVWETANGKRWAYFMGRKRLPVFRGLEDAVDVFVASVN